MTHPINSITISTEDAKTFQREGAIVLRNLIKPQAIEQIRQTLDQFAQKPPLGFPSRYKRIAHNLQNHTDIFNAMTSSEELGKIIEALTGRQLLLTQVFGMENEPSPEVATKWHYDQTSCGFISTDTQAYVFWFPLIKIEKTGQGGGIVWVPENVMNAKTKLTKWENYYLDLYDLKLECGEKYEALNKQYNYSTKYGLDWLSDDDFKTLDDNAIEPNFNIGDAFLMNRNVYHKTALFREGALDTRVVCAMRFIDAEAKLSRKLFEGLRIQARIEHRILPNICITNLLDLAEGDKVASSKYANKPFPAKKLQSKEKVLA